MMVLEKRTCNICGYVLMCCRVPDGHGGFIHHFVDLTVYPDVPGSSVTIDDCPGCYDELTIDSTSPINVHSIPLPTVSKHSAAKQDLARPTSLVEVTSPKGYTWLHGLLYLILLIPRFLVSCLHDLFGNLRFWLEARSSRSDAKDVSGQSDRDTFHPADHQPKTEEDER